MRHTISYILLVILMFLPLLIEALGITKLISILTYAFIMSIYALSFSFLLGYLGLLNFGHSLFFGLGAYLTTYQLIWLGVPYPLALLISTVLGSLIGLAVAFITRKMLRGIPFAFITLTLLLIIYSLYKRREFRIISGSEQGLIIYLPEILTSEMIPLISILIFVIILINILNEMREDFLNSSSNNNLSSFKRGTFLSKNILVLCLFCMIYISAIIILIRYLASKMPPYRVSINIYMISLTSLYLIYISLKTLIKRPIAVAWITTRDNETRAETLGYNSFMLKAIALVISGTIASLSGGLYILYSQNINPDTAFSPLLSVYGLVYSIIGGVYMIEGPIVGATLVTILEKYLSDFVGGWSVVATGIIFIAVVLYMPKGLSYYLWHALNKIFSRGFSIYGVKNKLVRQEKI